MITRRELILTGITLLMAGCTSRPEPTARSIDPEETVEFRNRYGIGILVVTRGNPLKAGKYSLNLYPGALMSQPYILDNVIRQSDFRLELTLSLERANLLHVKGSLGRADMPNFADGFQFGINPGDLKQPHSLRASWYTDPKLGEVRLNNQVYWNSRLLEIPKATSSPVSIPAPRQKAP